MQPGYYSLGNDGAGGGTGAGSGAVTSGLPSLTAGSCCCCSSHLIACFMQTCSHRVKTRKNEVKWNMKWERTRERYAFSTNHKKRMICMCAKKNSKLTCFECRYTLLSRESQFHSVQCKSHTVNCLNFCICFCIAAFNSFLLLDAFGLVKTPYFAKHFSNCVTVFFSFLHSFLRTSF